MKSVSISSASDFYLIYTEYKNLVRSIIYRINGEAELDDLVQDCFIKVWNAREKFRGEAEIKTWVCRIATNTALDHRRKRVVRQGTQLVEDVENFGTYKDPTFLKKTITDVIDELKEEFRSAFILVALSGLTTKEASLVLKVEEGTVRSRVSRARSRIKESLAKKGVNNESR